MYEYIPPSERCFNRIQISTIRKETWFAQLLLSSYKERLSKYLFLHVAGTMYKYVFLCTEIFLREEQRQGRGQRGVGKRS
jgi:hypothetical protein